MSKRAAEMIELVTFAQDMDGTLEPDDMGRWVRAESHFAAIRSLRVKLFRERARWHHERDRATRTVAEFCESDALFSQAHLEARAANRFMRIADAIERGEK